MLFWPLSFLRDFSADEENAIPSIKVSKIAHLDITSNGEALGTIDIGLFGDQVWLFKSKIWAVHLSSAAHFSWIERAGLILRLKQPKQCQKLQKTLHLFVKAGRIQWTKKSTNMRTLRFTGFPPDL